MFHVLSFIVFETRRLKARSRLLHGDNDSALIFQAKRLLNELGSTDNILNPERWNIDRLIRKPSGWLPPHEADITRIRKPEIETYLYITTKGNLSFRWRPACQNIFREDGHDWVRTPSDQPYAYERPENELLFIKDIANISPDPERHKYHQDCEERAAIDSMIATLIWAMIDHVHNFLRRTVIVHIKSHFRLITADKTAGTEYWPRHEVIGWEIVSSDQVLREDAERRIRGFVEEHGVSVAELCNIYVKSSISPNSTKKEEATILAKALRQRGHKLTSIPVQGLLSDLDIVHDMKLLDARRKSCGGPRI